MTEDFIKNHYTLRKGQMFKPMAHDGKRQDRKNRIFAIGVFVLIAVLIALSFTGCKTIQQQTAVHNRDSVRIEVRLDSIYVYEHDSIWRDRWRQGDTVFVTVEKWKTRYRDKLREVHDTIAVVKTDSVTTVVSVPRPRTGYDRFCSGFFWTVAVILLLLAGFWICDHIPACKPWTTAIKLFLRI